MSAPSKSLVYGSQFGFALVLLFAEVYLFNLVSFVNNPHTASFAVSITLAGLSLGAVGAYVRPPAELARAVRWMGPVAGALFLAHLLSIPAIGTQFSLAVFILVPAFSAIGYVLSAAYFYAPPGRVVFVELAGAAVGSFLVYIALNKVGLEATGGLIFAVSLCLGLLGQGAELRVADVPKSMAVRILVPILCLIGAVSFSAEPTPFLSETVIQPDPSWVHEESIPSFEGRVDAYSKDNPIGPVVGVYANGILQDHISSAPEEVWQLDPRLPAALFENPRIFIIGASAQGIIQPAKRIPGAEIESVELNRGIAWLMEERFYDFSGGGYDGITVSIDEGRSYISRSDSKWDAITLMNPHPYGSRYVPDYLHTTEAYDLYLDHLTPVGSVVIEESVISDADVAAAVQTVLTIRETLLRRGVEKPEDSIIMWAWSTSQTGVFPYFHLIFRDQPYSSEEIARLDAFFERLDQRTDYGVGWLHRPGRPEDNPVSDAMMSGEVPGSIDQERFHIGLVTDLHPFPKVVETSPAELRRMFWWSTTLFLALLVILAIAEWRVGDRGQRNISQSAARMGFFGGLGVALLMLEFYLIHTVHLFVGAPSLSFLLVLIALLIGGSIGGLLSQRLRLQRWLLPIGVTLIVLLINPVTSPTGVFASLAELQLTARCVAVFCGVLLLGCLHGSMFPSMMNHVREQSEGPRKLALLYGVNSAATVIGSVYAIFFSVRLGIDSTLYITLGCYTLVLLSALVLKPWRRPNTQS